MAAYLIVMRSESIQDADAMAEYQRRTREIHPQKAQNGRE